MARRPDLERFAAEHGLKIGTIADLIHYRIQNEKTIERVAECELATEHGHFRLLAYQDIIDRELHMALVMGEVGQDRPTLVRVHVQDTVCDVLGARQEDCGWPLRSALRRVAAEGAGVVVLLRKGEDARELTRRIRSYQLGGARHEAPTDLRTHGLGAQILADLGVRRMRVLSAPKRMHGLSGFDLEVVEYVEPD
jgi:3,4-dihydroxy 2-butanone 4-phosphate synthase / GTP cyclohydrolase II